MQLAGFGSPSLSQLNQLSNALNHHHPQSGGGIMSPSLVNSPAAYSAYSPAPGKRT